MTDRETKEYQPDSLSISESADLLDHESSHQFLDGVRQFCEGHFEESLRKFKTAIVPEPQNQRYLAACGHALLHLGDLPGAMEYYDRAVREPGQDREALYNKARILQKWERTEEAAEIFARTLQKPPPVNSGRFYLGLQFHSKEELLGEITINLGKFHRERGEVNRARDFFVRALDYQPQNITALQNLAELAIYTKNFYDARRYLEQILESSPLEEDKINAHNNLGLVCYELGETEQGVQHLTWVLRHSPGNPSAIHNLNHIYEREGVFTTDGPLPPAIRFMDMREGASPIFELVGVEDEADVAGVTIIGRSQEMLRVMRHARVASASDSPVLIQGEKGVGKELIARAIHLNSARHDRPFVVVNCADIPELMLESELFGHEKGAFTGAHTRKVGKIEAAGGGTLFLDEVAQISMMTQSKLLRALQDRHFTTLNGTRPIEIHIRIICASSSDVAATVKKEKFREDLYFLLNVLPIAIPPLRERPDDIPLLVDHFARKFRRKNQNDRLVLSREDLQVLMEYDWPGNVRELENLVQRALVMGTQSSLYIEEIARLRRSRSSNPRRKNRTTLESIVNYPVQTSLAELEKKHILAMLEATQHNQRRAANLLGINPSTLWRKLKNYGIELSREKGK